MKAERKKNGRGPTPTAEPPMGARDFMAALCAAGICAASGNHVGQVSIYADRTAQLAYEVADALMAHSDRGRAGR